MPDRESSSGSTQSASAENDRDRSHFQTDDSTPWSVLGTACVWIGITITVMFGSNQEGHLNGKVLGVGITFTVLAYLIRLGLICGTDHTYKCLLNVTGIAEIQQNMEQVRQAPSYLVWKMKCFHRKGGTVINHCASTVRPTMNNVDF